MKSSPKPWLQRLAAISFFLPLTTHSQTLRVHGVLGNSGEQGESLVKFTGKPTSGLGIAVDPTGTILDRGGEESLNRYTLDGRQIASYPLPKNTSTNRDKITILGDDILLNLNKKLYSLPLASPTHTAPTALPTAVSQISFNHHEGWAAASNGKEILLINRHGETRPVTTLEKEPYEIEVGPRGGIFITIDGKITRIDKDAPAGKSGPWESPGDRSQWLNNAWWGSAGHGTLRRFNADFQQDPGVVLGGASGWFIGYVEGNHELDKGCGLAHLGGNLYAVSGADATVHLLEWHATDQRFTLIRRIGAVPECAALAIDSKGRVWHNTGVWNWTDHPDTPAHHSVPGPTGGLRGVVMLDNDIMTGPGNRWGKPSLYFGDLEGPAKIDDKINYPINATATALIQWQKKPALFIADPTGKGTVTLINSEGKSQDKVGELDLKLTALTSFATSGETLLAATDGHIIEFGSDFKQTKHWNSWSENPSDHFGKTIHIATDKTHLWVTDTTRHRILVFDLKTQKPITQFGLTDQPGNDLTHLNSPKVIAANNHRAVLHDSQNQRLIQLELTP